MSIVRWEDPPPDRFRWKNIAEELREHPGRWALVMEQTDKGAAANCFNGLAKRGCE